MNMGELHAAVRRTAFFRFYQELNDFLPVTRRQKTFAYEFCHSPSVKDTIEAASSASSRLISRSVAVAAGLCG